MAPQTPHLRAVAGWQREAGGEDRRRERRAGSGSGDRRPRARPVIYAGLRICVPTKNVHMSAVNSRTGEGLEVRWTLLSPLEMSVWQVKRVCVCVFAPWQRDGCIGKMWEAFLCYWRVEEWMGGFHPGLSLIREGSLIPSHPMVWFICMLWQEVMEFCFTIRSENPWRHKTWSDAYAAASELPSDWLFRLSLSLFLCLSRLLSLFVGKYLS